MNYLRYATVFFAVAVGVAVVVALLNTATRSGLGSSVQLMVPAMIAALIEGQRFAKTRKRKPTGATAWTFTWIATGIAVALNLALACLGPAVAPEFSRLAIAPFLSRQFVILLGLYAGGYVLCNRFFLSIGAGNQLSLMRRRGEID